MASTYRTVRLIRRAALASAAAGVFISSGAYAAPLDDDPFAGEVAMSDDELMEQRGGFEVGGFKFDFGVEVAPVTVAPVQLGNVGADLPDDGPLGSGGALGPNGVELTGPGGAQLSPDQQAAANAVLGDNGPLGAFGEDGSLTISKDGASVQGGVFGPEKVTGAQLPKSSSAPKAQPVPTIIPSTGGQQGGGSLIPSVPKAPAVNVPSSGAQASNLGGGSSNSDLIGKATNVVPTGDQLVSLGGTVGNAATDAAQSGIQAAQKQTPSAAAGPTQQQVQAPAPQQTFVLQNSITDVLINNSRDSVMLFQNVDINVVVENFHDVLQWKAVENALSQAVLPMHSMLGSLSN